MDKFMSSAFTLLEARPRVLGSRIGAIVGIEGGPIVDFTGNPLGPQPARLVSALTAAAVTTAYEAHLPVLLLFEEDDAARPIVVDIVIDHPRGARSGDVLPANPTPSVPQADSGSRLVPADVARIAAVEQEHVVVRRCAPAGGLLRAKTIIPLRNLKDPVVLLSLADGSAVVVGQLYPSIPVEPSGGGGGEVLVRGERVTIEADAELVLRSGACVLHLDARGRAVLTADHVVSRARAANRIQGGTVHLN